MIFTEIYHPYWIDKSCGWVKVMTLMIYIEENRWQLLLQWEYLNVVD